MISSLGPLSDNLQEIHYAVKNANSQNLALVANFSGNRIYDSRYGWGRLWRWFYNAVECVLGNEWRLSKLQKAILHTHQLFQKGLIQLKPLLERYQAYLRQAGNEYALSDTNHFALKNVISKWNAATKPFVTDSLFTSKNNTDYLRYEKLLRYCFGEDLSQEDLSLKFNIPPLEHQELRFCQKIIDLEAISDGALPLAVFKKVFKNKILNPLDYKSLDRWIKKINTNTACLKVVHSGIKALARHYLKKDDINLTSVPRLEAILTTRGCRVFEEIDNQHFAWRQSLKPGSLLSFNLKEETQGDELSLNSESDLSTIETDNAFSVSRVNSKTITLGKEICSSSSNELRTRVFNIKEIPSHVVIIAQNRAILAIRNIREHFQTEFDINPILFEDITRDGSLGFMEKLQPLNAKKWTSIHGKISEEDTPALEMLLSFLQQLVSHSQSLANLTAPSLMYDKEFKLKTLKPIKKVPFDFNALENFACECAGGNLTVFQHLMKNSGLSKLPTALFYREVFENTIKGESINFSDLAGIYKISDPKIVDRSSVLSREIISHQHRLWIQIKEFQPDRESKILKEQISKTLFSCYQATGTASFLWPSLAQDVFITITS